MQHIHMPTKIYKIHYLNFKFSIFSFPNYSKEYSNEAAYKVF